MRLGDRFVYRRADFGGFEATADVDRVAVLPTVAHVDAATDDLENPARHVAQRRPEPGNERDSAAGSTRA